MVSRKVAKRRSNHRTGQRSKDVKMQRMLLLKPIPGPKTESPLADNSAATINEIERGVSVHEVAQLLNEGAEMRRTGKRLRPSQPGFNLFNCLPKKAIIVIIIAGLFALLALVAVTARHHTIRQQHYDASNAYASDTARCHDKWTLANGTCLHQPKSRPRRKAPNALTNAGTLVNVITDPRRIEFIAKKITEQLSVLLRGVRIVPCSLLKPGLLLPHWLVPEYYDEGVTLGPSRLTKYVVTEGCDRQVWKLHPFGIKGLRHVGEVPSELLAECQLPIYPLYYGIKENDQGDAVEAMSMLGISLHRLMQLNIVGPDMDDKRMQWFFHHVVRKTLGAVDHMERSTFAKGVKMVHKCLDARSIIILLDQPFFLGNGKSLSEYDGIALARMQCAAADNWRKGLEVEPESAYCSTEMRDDFNAQPDTAAENFQKCLLTRRTPFHHIGQVILDATGLTKTEINGKMKFEGRAIRAGSWLAEREDELLQLFGHLRHATGLQLPDAASIRWFKIFRDPSSKNSRHSPNMFVNRTRISFTDGVEILPAFAGRVQALQILIEVGASPAGPAMRVYRNFYPSLWPFARVDCYVKNLEKITLCRPSDLRTKIYNEWRVGNPWLNPPMPWQNEEDVRIECPSDAEYPGGYPSGWTQKRCNDHFNRRDAAPLSNSIGVVMLNIQFCDKGRGMVGTLQVREVKANHLLGGSSYIVKCCGPEKDQGTTKNVCSSLPTPELASPWDKRRYFAVDDVLGVNDPDDDGYKTTSPLLPACTWATPEQRQRQELPALSPMTLGYTISRFYKEAHRAHLVQQNKCMSLSSGQPDGVYQTRSHQWMRYLEDNVKTDDNRKIMWMYFNNRFDNRRDEDGDRMDRCGSEQDVALFMKFCGDRSHDYECIIVDKNFTAEEMMRLIWAKMETMDNYKGFFWSVSSHGNSEDGRHIMLFPGQPGEPDTAIDLDAFTAELFGPDNKQLYGKLKYSTQGLCRGGEADVTTYEDDPPQRRTKREAPTRVPVMKAPDAVKNKQRSTQTTYLDWLHDTASSRQLVVKSSADSCVSIRHTKGTKFLQRHFSVASKHKDESVKQLWARTTGAITHEGWREKDDAGRSYTARQTVTVTKDTYGHPSFHYAMPSSSQKLSDIRLETQWSAAAQQHCAALVARRQQPPQQQPAQQQQAQQPQPGPAQQPQPGPAQQPQPGPSTCAASGCADTLGQCV